MLERVTSRLFNDSVRRKVDNQSKILHTQRERIMALQQKPNISKHETKLVYKPIYERYEEIVKKKS